MFLKIFFALAAIAVCCAQRCKTTMDCPQFSSCINIEDTDAGQCMCEYDGVPDHLAACKSANDVVRRRQESGPTQQEQNQEKASNACPNLYDAPSPSYAQCNNGGKCYAFNSTISFCVCMEGYSQRTCDVALALDKRPEYYKQPYTAMESRRLTSTSFDSIVFARYFATDMDRCMFTCRAAGEVCQAVNFGRYDAVNDQRFICELLAVKAETEYDLMWRFLKFDALWTYAYKMNDFNVRPTGFNVEATSTAAIAQGTSAAAIGQPAVTTSQPIVESTFSQTEAFVEGASVFVTQAQ